MIPKFCIVLLFGALAAGCSFGHSRNERPAQNYPTFIMSLYDNPTPAPRSGAPVAPMRVAVAQVGELAPPQAMLEHLRQNPAMFQRVEGIPAVFDDYSQTGALPTTRPGEISLHEPHKRALPSQPPRVPFGPEYPLCHRPFSSTAFRP